MAGLGLATSLGAGHRITTVVGSPMATRGRGGPVRCMRAITRSGRRRTSRSGDGAAALASELALAVGGASAGSRSDRVTASIRGGVDTAGGSAWSMYITFTTSINSVESGHCTAERGSRISRIFTTTMFSGQCRRSMRDTSALAGSLPVAASHAQMSGARMMAGNLPVVPSHASLSASGRAAAPSTVRNSGSQRFFGSAHNNVARPASFQQETASLRQTMQQNHVGAVPAGGRASAGGSAGMRGPTPTSNMQRPSAGTLSNREMNNPGNRTAGNQPSSSQTGNRGAFPPFTPPSGNSRPSTLGSSERTSPGSGVMEPQRGGTASAPSSNRDGFRPFTPPSGSAAPRGVSNAPVTRGSSGGYWNRTAPSSMESRGSGSYPGSSGRGASSRPQLDMRQPIARSPNGGYPRGGYPSYRGAPSYGGSRGVPSYGGSHSAPSYGGGRPSAPSGGGHPSGGGGGGHLPSGGGGHPSGGGGHSGGGHH